MGFFSHAAALGVGYFIGKSYCFRYKVHRLPEDVDGSEIHFRVERKEGGYPMFWGNPWWNHHYHHHCDYQHYQKKEIQRENSEKQIPQKNPELLEVEKSQ